MAKAEKKNTKSKKLRQAVSEEENPVEQAQTEEENSPQPAPMEDCGMIAASHKGKNIRCLTIIGEIEGHFILPAQNKTTKYEHVIPRLVAVEEDQNVDGLLILINTVGGDVEAGLAIAEVISGMKKPTVSIVLGGGHSIGIPLAVAAKKSFIARSASMTVHPVRTNGITLGVSQSFEYFKRMQDRINNFVCRNSNISKERYSELVLNTGELVMDVGTILEGEDAVEEGLIDSVGSVSDAMECLYSMIGKGRSRTKRKSKQEKENN